MMHKDQKTMQYHNLIDAAIACPLRIDLWRILSKIAPTPSASVTFSKMADFLQSNKTSRKYVYLNPSLHDVTSVTFVVLATPIFGRVNKVAHAARAAGLKIQLILCSQNAQDAAIDPTLYDETVIVDDIHLHLNDVLKIIRKFGSSLIHMFVDCCTNYKAALWAVRAPLPLVGDAYDLCCSQYTTWAHDPEGCKQNVFFENVWLQHMDGFCTRTHYMKTKRLRAAYRTGIPVYYMPEPARTDSLCFKTGRADPESIHILMDGLGADTAGYDKAFEEIFSHVIQAGNIHLYLYRYTGRDLSEYKDVIHTYPRLPERIMTQLMHKCDAFMLPWCPNYCEDNGYSYAMAKYGTRTTATDIMEADCINIVPDYFELIGKNAVKCNRGIVFGEADQQNIEFWKSLPNKIDDLLKKTSDRSRFLDTTIAPHLRHFYQRVVDKVVMAQTNNAQK